MILAGAPSCFKSCRDEGRDNTGCSSIANSDIGPRCDAKYVENGEKILEWQGWIVT
jgi:hypothetical protein